MNFFGIGKFCRQLRGQGLSGSLVARVGLACFGSGVILLYGQTALPPLHWVILVTALAFLPPLYGRISGRKLPGTFLCVMIAAFLAGFAWSIWQAKTQLAERLPQSMEGKIVSVSGTLCGVPEPGSFGSVRFPFCVSQWHHLDAENLPSRLRLSWYGEDARRDLPPQLRLTVVLKRPHGAVNPRGFRYESWLFRQGYGATGTIRAVEPDLSVPCGITCHYHRWRGTLVDGLKAHLGNAESAPLIASLMLGYRGDLEAHHWQVLKATGTIHLVAISGLHLGLVAIAAGFLIRRLLIWAPEPWLSPARLRVITFAMVCSVTLIYALAAGFSVPTRRALLMVMVACWWVLSARKSQPFDAVLIAFFLVLLLDPLSPLDQGFWLSFGAVAVLTLVFSGLLGQKPWWQSLILAQVAIFAALWPILAFLDQGQPAIGFVANLIAIPLVSLLVMPAIFACAVILLLAPGIGDLAIGGLDMLLGGFWWFLQGISTIELPLLMPPMSQLIPAAVVIVLALVLPFTGFRLMAVTVVIFWLTFSAVYVVQPLGANKNPYTLSEVWVWDVGQGLSLLVRHEGRTLLYDTGPELEGVYSAVESVVVPNLRALGIEHIDTLVISHADNDHSGGIPQLHEHVSVGRIISGEPERLRKRLDSELGGRVEFCESSRISQRSFSYWRSVEGAQGNDASCVLTLSFNQGRQTLILSGDISEQAERAFLDEQGELEAIRSSHLVVLAPHHGSKTSSSRYWVDALQPDTVVFSAGYRHRYGHPHPEIVSRYEASGSRVFNTASSGAIRLVFGLEDVIVEEARTSAPFWIRRGTGAD
ncbi:DNA internalization-related competence protein ComEC/Rec2 [Marinobacter sp. CHS3-4]|uniref:DNA internalization-related competence protein ComEC/Rec2 n=1 Tax=Marinobacter sp. CHS3-4 TaxID=3045174 RepID=UPI0024B5F8A3|nr:DNA internalization-related competence protein ComEC/Rec2 [Marinobacter sp. CHS3-4]MDI9245677.1 DNA internalization-related competence protein ComEC/Rec2 [Marinobacter sp. CHS3-4]